MVALREINGFFSWVICVKSVNYYKLEFHLFFNNAFNIYARVLPHKHVRRVFRKPRKVRRKLNKNAVAFNASYNAAYCFADREKLGTSREALCAKA